MSDGKAYQSEMLLRGYKYLYYRIYAWNLRMWGESDLPQFNALFGVSFLIFLNIMTLLDLVDLCAGRHVVPFSRPTVIGTVLVVIVIGYFILVHNGKYRTIAKEFSNETPAQRR